MFVGGNYRIEETKDVPQQGGKTSWKSLLELLFGLFSLLDAIRASGLRV